MRITIIGAGLTGLSIAYLLKKEGISSQIIEARERIGGRILTVQNNDEAPVEMGATWLGLKHRNLVDLLKELNIEIYEQFTGDLAVYEAMSTSPPQLVSLPENPEPSYRIKGGTITLIEELRKHLKEQPIYLGEIVQSIHLNKDKLIEIKTNKNQYKSEYVIFTLPPFLLAKTIEILPALPNKLQEIAYHTHIWMGESIKVGLRYAKPFWREKNTSGTIFSNVGPVTEMYDHSNFELSTFALKGFMNSAYASATKEIRKRLILNQLRKYYGNIVDNFLSYEETVWSNEPFTFTNYETAILPHQNNGNPIFKNNYFEGKLIITGSETAVQFPGYMEGAVSSAKSAVEKLSTVLV